MNFEWDENKNIVNIRKHKIDFSDVPLVFDKTMLIDYDDSQIYDEDRWIGIGLLQNIVVVIVFTERNQNTIRIISARKATRSEREKYYEKIF
ncbi:BrnT family toxin [Desulfonema limicola]|uniref:BrnT family toxin n=1 Tax=Desulfonema limicola TaxID=45656 RepID=UPI001A9B36B9|nr:BrnT family toxin [Desulfonema limicola]